MQKNRRLIQRMLDRKSPVAKNQAAFLAPAAVPVSAADGWGEVLRVQAGERGEHARLSMSLVGLRVWRRVGLWQSAPGTWGHRSCGCSAAVEGSAFGGKKIAWVHFVHVLKG